MVFIRGLYIFRFLKNITVMLSNTQILEAIKSKVKGNAIRVTTQDSSYLGRLYEYNEQKIVLRPYCTNKADDVQLHYNLKDLSLDEIINVD